MQCSPGSSQLSNLTGDIGPVWRARLQPQAKKNGAQRRSSSRAELPPAIDGGWGEVLDLPGRRHSLAWLFSGWDKRMAGFARVCRKKQAIAPALML